MPDYQFINRFLDESSTATAEQKNQLKAQLNQLQELISAPADSNILAHIEWLAATVEKPQQLINLLHLCLMPFVVRKQAMQAWYDAEIEKLPVEISNLSKRIVTFLKITQVREYRDSQYEYQTLPEKRNKLKNDDINIASIDSKIDAAYKKLCDLKENDPNVKLYNEVQNQRDNLVRKRQELLTERERLSFPATHVPAIYHAIKFLDVKEDMINYIPYISIIPTNNDIEKPYIGYLDSELFNHNIVQRTLNEQNYYLHLDTGSNIFYHTERKNVGEDSHCMSGQGLTIRPIETQIKDPNYNFDLELINQFLAKLHLINTYTAVINLHPDLFANHFSSIMSLPLNWLSPTGINLLNEIDHNLLCIETFNELSLFDPLQVAHYQNIIDKFCSIEQKLAQLFKQHFPKEKTPDSFSEFKPYLRNTDFLSAVLEFAGGSLLNNEELFNIDELITLIVNAPQQKNIIQKLSQDRLMQICFYTPKRRNNEPNIEQQQIIDAELHIKEDIYFDNNILMKILFNTENKLPLATWHVLLLKLANEDSCLDVIYHIRSFYPSGYIGFICDLIADKGLKDIKIIKLIYEKNIIKIGDFKQSNLLLNTTQQDAKDTFITCSRRDFFNEKIKLSHDSLNMDVIKNFFSLIKRNVFKSNINQLETLAKEHKFKLNNGKYRYNGSNEDQIMIVEILNLLRTTLRDKTVDCVKLNSTINTLIKSLPNEAERGRLEKLVSPSFNKLKTFLHNLSSQLAKREELFNNINNEADLYFLLLTPKIYYNLTPDELTFFFSRINPDIMAKIITEFYGPEQFQSFASSLNKKMLKFEDLDLILKEKNTYKDLNSYNFLRHEHGFPTVLPEGATYTGEHYVNAFPLSAEHLYQFEASDMTAGEGILRSMYPACLTNLKPDRKSASMSLDPILMPLGKKISSNKLPYHFYLILDSAVRT